MADAILVRTLWADGGSTRTAPIQRAEAQQSIATSKICSCPARLAFWVGAVIIKLRRL